MGSKQRTFNSYNKTDEASPTVSTDGLIVTCAIDTQKKRDVANCDLPGAFTHRENDEYIIIQL